MATTCTSAQLSVLSTIFNSDTSGNIVKAICSSTALQNSGVDIYSMNANLNGNISAIQAWQLDISFGVDAGWLITCGAMVFIMHGGFAMVSLVLVLGLNMYDIIMC